MSASRTHTFTTAAPVRLDVSFANGSLSVEAAPVEETTVVVTGPDPDRIQVLQDDDLVSVTEPRSHGVLVASRGHHITVTVPERSAVRARTGSATVSTEGPLRSAQAKTGSGDVRLALVEGPADLATGSGDVTVERITGELLVKTGSGDVEVGQPSGALSVATGSGDVVLGPVDVDAEVKTGSGDLRVTSVTATLTFSTGSGSLHVLRAGSGRISAKGASGDVRIGVPAGTPVWTDITTVSGRIRSDIESAGQPGPGQDHVALTARTVSGDVTLVPA